MTKPNTAKRARTRRGIMDAYIDLLKEGSKRPVTASAVIERACINRSTFYEYFKSVEELKEAVEDDVIESMASTARSSLDSKGEPDTTAMVADAYRQHGELIGLLLGQQSTSYFVSRVKAVLMPLIARALEGEVEQDELPYVSEFVASGLIGFYGHWFDEGQDLSIDKLVHLARNLAFSCMEGAKKFEEADRALPEE